MGLVFYLWSVPGIWRDQVLEEAGHLAAGDDSTPAQHSHDLCLCPIVSYCPAPTRKYLALDLVSPQVNSAIPNLLAKSIFAGRRGDALHHGDALLEDGGRDAGLGAWECEQPCCGQFVFLLHTANWSGFPVPHSI